MLKKIMNLEQEQVPQEGDLYKIIQFQGRTFEIRYGYYEECDRHARYAEPMAIYPDFIKDPRYTDNGMPFATAAQTPCDHFSGKINENSTCEDCNFYQPGEDLIGLCTDPQKRQGGKNHEK